MKKLLSLLFICNCLVGFGQTVPITTVEIPTTADDLNRPGGGAEQWTFGQNIINIPNQCCNTIRVMAYNRYPWYNVESPSATTPGANMDYSHIDADVQDAITKGQIFGFGILVNFGDLAPLVSGTKCVYPIGMHNGMQGEATHDVVAGGYWTEQTNSPTYLTWYTALLNNIANHFATTSFNGVSYSSVLKYVDIRINGDFGEGAVKEAGVTNATSVACNAIIDAYKAAFHQYYLTGMIGNFSGGIPGPTGTGITPLATSTYLLKLTTDKGPIGWRRDNYGQVDNYIRLWTDLNPNVDAGYHYDTAIQNRYRQAPVRGEPQDGGPGLGSGFGAGNFEDFVTQVTRDHTQSFGNGNFNGAINATIQNNFRLASKASGYRLVPNTGTATQTPIAGGPWSITMNWKNINGIPTYEDWNVIYEWKNSSGTVVQRFTSTFKPYLFRSTTNVATTDNFTLTTVPAGTGYTLSVRVEDPLNYMKPMPLFINGRDASGAYPLLQNVTVTTSGAVANAGANQSIIVNNTFLTSTSISATSQIWSQVSGPNTAGIGTPTGISTAITGLITGTYVFRLSINGGSSGPLVSTVTVIVAIPVPIANAGPNQNIIITTVTLNGSGSQNSSTYAWTRISGPNTPSITTPTAVSTTVTGLITGTYVFQLAVNGGTVSPQISQVSIIVNATPVQANAGSSQTVTLPIASVTLNGGASTGVTSWSWTQLSGPNTAAITSPTLGVTTVTGLIAGAYIFQLSINSGASTSQVTITVLPAPVVIANAGSNQTITLPINTVGFDGNGSIGAISYLWTNVSGPTTPVILTPTLVTAGAANLIQGTYIFDLSINGGVSHSRITVVVLPAPLPVANAGVSQTISLPISAATLNANQSTGLISTYTWTLFSGPNTPTLVNANSAIATVSNLIIDTYVFKITLNGGSNDTMRIFVNPIPSVGTGTTVFTAQTPAGGGTTLTDNAQLEVGMKFRSSINTYVTGVRFYKASGNTGTHIGELYSYPAGVRLAQVTFTSETLTGWQQASFFPAIQITAGTTYIISYWSSLGFYSSTNNYFATAVTNSPLTGLADGTDGPNGVYRYTNIPAFPNATFQKANYWVDPITNPNAPDYILRTGFRKIYVKDIP